MRFLVLILLLGVFGSAGLARAAEPDAQAALEQALALVEQAERADPAEQSALAERAAMALDAAPDLAERAWLTDPLRAPRPDLERARARLEAALEVMAAPSVRAIDHGTARGALDEVLADKRFHPQDVRSLLPVWLVPLADVIDAAFQLVSRVVRWPFERLLDLLRWFRASPGYAVLIAVLGLLAVAGIVLLYRRALRSALIAQAEIAPEPVDLPLTAADAARLAEHYAAEHRYRDACHFLFLATLLGIEERGLAQFDRAATNREHLARLGDQPGIFSALARLVDRFDRLWYGQDAVTATDFQGLARLAEAVREAA